MNGKTRSYKWLKRLRVGDPRQFLSNLLKKPGRHVGGIRLEILVTFDEECSNRRGEYTRLEIVLQMLTGRNRQPVVQNAHKRGFHPCHPSNVKPFHGHAYRRVRWREPTSSWKGHRQVARLEADHRVLELKESRDVAIPNRILTFRYLSLFLVLNGGLFRHNERRFATEGRTSLIGNLRRIYRKIVKARLGQFQWSPVTSGAHLWSKSQRRAQTRAQSCQADKTSVCQRSTCLLQYI